MFLVFFFRFFRFSKKCKYVHIYDFLISPRSRVAVVDKTSVLYGLCIKVLRCKFVAKMGDIFLLSLRARDAKKYLLLKLRMQRKFLLGSLHRALLVRSKFRFKRLSGLYISFFENACILVNLRVVPLSNRIYGPILKEFCMVWPTIGCVSTSIV